VNDSFRLNGSIHVAGRGVRVPRLGSIRTKESTQKFRGRILSATVRREAGRWYVSLTVEAERSEPLPVVGPVVGVDLGLLSFGVVSDGASEERIEAPKPLARQLRLLKRRSRAHSRKRRGSRNRARSGLRMARLHRRIRNVRSNFLHKVSTRLARTKSVVVLEDLNVGGMVRNRHLARHICDAGWSSFRRMLEYKSRWYGSKVVFAPRFFPSSKQRGECGHVVENLPLERECGCARRAASSTIGTLSTATRIDLHLRVGHLANHRCRLPHPRWSTLAVMPEQIQAMARSDASGSCR
jgi:putative transposase